MEIENDYPVPPQGSVGPANHWPFTVMTKGQSVFVPHESTGGTTYMKAIKHGAKTGKKFSGRKVEGGIRIWRVE